MARVFVKMPIAPPRNEKRDIVDGRNPANHLGFIKPHANNGKFSISTAGKILPSTAWAKRALKKI